jgi:hypothetical protein
MVSHTNTGEWQSFEIRMRHRRAERLALRAEVAAEAGCVDDARECLAEARTLAPALPSVTAAEAVIAQAEARIAAVDDAPAEAAPVVARGSRRWISYTVAATIAIAVVLGVTWRSGRPASQTVDAQAAAVTPQPIVVDAPALASPADATRAPQTDPEPVAPPASTPADSQLQLASATRTAADDRDARRLARDGRVTSETHDSATPDAPRRIAPPDLPAVSSMPISAPRPAPPAVSETPLSSSFSTPGTPVSGPIAVPPSPSAAPAPDTATAALSQDSVVRNVLSRYASAYNALDVDAATRVWPGVNRGALARAFDGLASQQVSLGDCRIDVAGAKAQARCAGRATWTPKIGSGTHTESRSWTFELARAGNDWQIVSARVQNR